MISLLLHSIKWITTTIFFLQLLSCIPKKNNKLDECKINVTVPKIWDLEGKTIFLGNVLTKEFIDSTIVKNNKFTMRINSSQINNTCNVQLLFKPIDTINYYRPLGIKNPFKKTT